MTLESTLVDGSWVVVPEFLMLPEFGKSKKFMFVSENLLVPRAEIAHDFSVRRLDMAVQVWPTQASNIAVTIRTIVLE